MRIKTKNKIVEVSNIEFDEGRCIIYTDEVAIIIDNYITFTEYLEQEYSKEEDRQLYV